MTRFSAFSRFGFARFSSRKTYHQIIFETLRDGQGPGYDPDFNSVQSARLFAAAACLASSQYMLERAYNNANPLKATELLGELEKEYGLIPAQDATLPQRRSELAARVLIIRGAARYAVMDALRLVLGSDFVDYRTSEAPGVYPTTMQLAAKQGTFTTDTTDRKTLRITECISVGLGLPKTVHFTAYDPTETLPLLFAGEKLLVDPAVMRETVTIESVSADTFTATFALPHDALSPATTARVPVWVSTQRHSLIVLTTEAALDPERRRKANDVLKRIMRGVSTWDLCDESGPFRVGVGKLGVTAIGEF